VADTTKVFIVAGIWAAVTGLHWTQWTVGMKNLADISEL